MQFCPNKSHPMYREIVDQLGEDKAMQAYILNRFDIPGSVTEAKRILEKEKEGVPIVPAQLVKKVKETLQKQRKIYQQQPLAQRLVQEIDTILFNLDQGNRYEGMMYLIRAANSKVAFAEQRINSIKDKLLTGEYDKLSDAEKKDIAETLNDAKEFVSTYNVLDDIYKQVFRQENSSVFGKHGSWLGDAIQRRRDIISDYQDLSYALTVKWLKPQMDRVNENLRKRGKDDMQLTEDRLMELLKYADADVSVVTGLIGTVANSRDPVLGLVASTIKREIENSRMAQIERRDKLYSLYKAVPGSTGDQEEFNKPYYHYVEHKQFVPEVDKNGKPIIENGKKLGKWEYTKVAAFHTPLRTDLFEKNKDLFFEKLKAKYGDRKPLIGTQEYLEWTKEVSAWYKANTEITNTNTLIEEKRSTLSPQKFQRWLEDNTTEIDNYTYEDGTSVADYYNPNEIYSKNSKKIVLYSGEFKQPSTAKYRNDKYYQLVNSNPYYAELYKAYEEANNKLHPARRLKHGIIPQDIDDRRISYIKDPIKAAKADAKRFIQIDSYDREFGVITPSGELKKYVPIHFTELLPDDQLSKDLLQSVLKFSQMADTYEGMNKILPNVSILTDLVKGNVQLNITPRTALGELKDAVTNAEWTEADAQKINNQLLEFLDKVVYGQGEIIDKIPGTNITVNKLAQKAGALTAAIQLMGNLTSAINNATIGNFQNLMQTVGGRYFSAGDYASATAEYTASMPQLVQDVVDGVPKSKIGILAEVYDAVQGEFADMYGRKITGGYARRLMTTDAGYFLMKGTEQQIQYTAMIALLKGTKVKFKGQEISLWEAYDNKCKLKPGVEWTEENRFNLMQKLHKMNKELHGVYNQFDSPSLSRRWYGKLIMMFRKYVYPSIRKRWGRGYVDMEEGEWTAGYYRVFINKVLQGFKEKSLEAWNGATPEEREAIKKSLVEISAFITANILIFGLSGLDDDDEATQHVELQLRRFSDDVGFYMGDVNALMRIMSTPAVSMGVAEKLGRAMKQLIFAPTEVYERKTGRYNKGDYKLEKDITDLVPILSKIYDIQDPESNLNFIKQRALF